MDSLHDLGGRQGFGPIVMEDKMTPFHDDWEVAAAAISANLVGRRIYNMDEFRHAIERMAPRHYIGASYFERTLTAAATLCVEKGLVTHEELNRLAGDVFPLARPSKPGRIEDKELPHLEVGDWVQVKNEFFSGHIRLPAYVRGKVGQIVGVSPAYHFPDAAGHGLKSERQRSFDVRFNSRDLWADCVDDAEVHVGLFHSYLTKTDKPLGAKG